MLKNEAKIILFGLLALQLASLVAFFAPHLGIPLSFAGGLSVLSFVLLVLFLIKQQASEKAFAKYAQHLEQVSASKKYSDSGLEEFATLDAQIKKMCADFSEFQMKEVALINHAVDVICSVGPDGIFRSVNPAARKVWGYDPQQLIGIPFSEIVVEDDRKGSMHSLVGAEKSVDALSFENRIRRKDGSVLHVLWSAHWSVVDQTLFCVAHDITARKMAEKLLEESEKRTRQIFETMPVGLLVTNKLAYIEMSNAAFCQMAGYSKQDLIGKQLPLVLADMESVLPTEDVTKALSRLADTRLLSSEGRYISVHLSFSDISMSGSKKYLIAFLDITERERLEELKSEFFAMVSHDLRSPLASLLTALEMFSDGSYGSLNDTGIQTARRNLREVERLIRLVDELLDIEKMKAGKFLVQPEMCSAKEIVEAATGAVIDFAQRRNINIVNNIGDIAAPLFVDSSLLIRVLVNLLSNAVKFSPSGKSIEIALSQKEGESIISVKDFGRGIPIEFRNKIFQQYEQVTDANQSANGAILASGKQKGTGLGLPICKLIIEQHGGKIWLESEVGQGSTFFFSLPNRVMTD